MKQALGEALFVRLSEFVARRTGLHFPRERWPQLECGVRTACRETGDDDVIGYAERLMASAAPESEIEPLVAQLTVAETYFFRDPGVFRVLERYIVPDLHPEGRPIRIWSAGCATGEEPYSIAIWLKQKFPDLAVGPLIIRGSDLNPRAIEKARAGIYRDWSFREAPSWVKSRYFSPAGDGCWALDEAVRKTVTFSVSNLVGDFALPPEKAAAQDLIFCKNVLMYLTPQARHKAVHRLRQSLAEGGWLIVGPAETCPALFSALSCVPLEGTTLYRKSSTRGAFQCSEVSEVEKESIPACRWAVHS